MLFDTSINVERQYEAGMQTRPMLACRSRQGLQRPQVVQQILLVLIRELIE